MHIPNDHHFWLTHCQPCASITQCKCWCCIQQWVTDGEYCPPIEEVHVEVPVQETLRPLLGDCWKSTHCFQQNVFDWNRHCIGCWGFLQVQKHATGALSVHPIQINKFPCVWSVSQRRENRHGKESPPNKMKQYWNWNELFTRWSPSLSAVIWLHHTRAQKHRK